MVERQNSLGGFLTSQVITCNQAIIPSLQYADVFVNLTLNCETLCLTAGEGWSFEEKIGGLKAWRVKYGCKPSRYHTSAHGLRRTSAGSGEGFAHKERGERALKRKVSLGTSLPPGAIWHLLRLVSVKRCDLCSKYIANKCGPESADELRRKERCRPDGMMGRRNKARAVWCSHLFRSQHKGSMPAIVCAHVCERKVEVKSRIRGGRNIWKMDCEAEQFTSRQSQLHTSVDWSSTAA
ncbi:hypothetical protein QQF64_013061 [Cirrhinus molitorella]|uniref:Uncharacterized protein n=1 Tax=Cirrhinus molitorella TaxID=172907 RepID=A0ABR3LRB7_9TELE